jgi:hypothetical protein
MVFPTLARAVALVIVAVVAQLAHAVALVLALVALLDLL